MLTFFIGVVYDVIGRKTPTLIFFVLMGFAIIVMPFFKGFFAGYVIMRAFVQLSAAVVATVPFAPDYVHSDSIGLAIGYG